MSSGFLLHRCKIISSGGFRYLFLKIHHSKYWNSYIFYWLTSTFFLTDSCFSSSSKNVKQKFWGVPHLLYLWFRKAIGIVKPLVGFRSQALEAPAILRYSKRPKNTTSRLFCRGKYITYHISKICKIAHVLERSWIFTKLIMVDATQVFLLF